MQLSSSPPVQQLSRQQNGVGRTFALVQVLSFAAQQPGPGSSSQHAAGQQSTNSSPEAQEPSSPSAQQSSSSSQHAAIQQSTSPAAQELSSPAVQQSIRSAASTRQQQPARSSPAASTRQQQPACPAVQQPSSPAAQQSSSPAASFNFRFFNCSMFSILNSQCQFFLFEKSLLQFSCVACVSILQFCVFHVFFMFSSSPSDQQPAQGSSSQHAAAQQPAPGSSSQHVQQSSSPAVQQPSIQFQFSIFQLFDVFNCSILNFSFSCSRNRCFNVHVCHVFRFFNYVIFIHLFNSSIFNF